MNVFDVIGPIMIGPSSSHTAGAARLGNVARTVFAREPKYAKIGLYGSFAKTGKGHGTDKALIAGVLGMQPDDVRLKESFEYAKKAGLEFSFENIEVPGGHPNTARISYTLKDGTKGVIEGSSIGGGNIRVDSVNGMRVDFTGEFNTILVIHKDTPGVIADVTNLMREKYSEINICNFKLSRIERGGTALMTIEIEGIYDDTMVSAINQVKYVDNAFMIRAI